MVMSTNLERSKSSLDNSDNLDLILFLSSKITSFPSISRSYIVCKFIFDIFCIFSGFQIEKFKTFAFISKKVATFKKY